MINTESFNKGIDRLESWDANYEISSQVRKAWLNELNALQVSEKDFKDGIDSIFSNPMDFKKRPALPELIKHCGDAKFRRWEKEEDEKKAKINYNDIKPATKHGKRAMTLIRLFIKGEYEKDGEIIMITPRDKIDYMLKMEELYPGYGWDKEAMILAREYGLR